MRNRKLLFLSLGVLTAFLFSACGTTRPLLPYERPLARTDFQIVRTTAYTHTESDHLEYGNRNALGGTLRPAGRPIHSAAVVPRALPVDESSDHEYGQGYSQRAPQPFRMSPITTRTTKTTIRSWTIGPSSHGSAAADWSRWPAGTIFRLLSTGQVYRVDDYGWALAGRNTIDLYMAMPSEMNTWGVRSEPIQILAWGDPQESLRLLRSRQDHRHIRRMVLELEGDHEAAAQLD